MASGWAEYDQSTVGKAPASTPLPTSTASKGGGSGTNDVTTSMTLIFYNEIMRLSNAVRPPIFDMGYITEIVGTKNFKYKVKLADLGSVVTATGADSNLVGFSWSRPSSMYLKGALVLVLCTPSSYTQPNSTVAYSIISVRQTGIFTPKVSEYPV